MFRKLFTRPRRPLLSLGAALALPLGLSLSAAAQDALPDDVFFEDTLALEGGFEGQAFSASGEVDRVDFAEGKLVVDGLIYRADPRALQGVQPGQQVFLTYEPIEGQAWISELQPAEGFFEGGAFWGPVF